MYIYFLSSKISFFKVFILGLAKALSPQPYNKTSVYNPRLSQEFNPKVKSAEDANQKSAIPPKNPRNSETSPRTPSWETELVWRAEPSRVEEDSISSISLNTDPVISKPPPVPKEDVSPKTKKQHSINKVTLLQSSRYAIIQDTELNVTKLR